MNSATPVKEQERVNWSSYFEDRAFADIFSAFEVAPKKRKTLCKHSCCKFTADSTYAAEPTASGSPQAVIPAAVLASPDPVRYGPAWSPVLKGEPVLPPKLFNVSGVTRVINTPELQEMILQFLSPAELQPLIRVDRRWNRVIGGFSLQQALFRRADHRTVDHPTIKTSFFETSTCRLFHDGLFKYVQPEKRDDEIDEANGIFDERNDRI